MAILKGIDVVLHGETQTGTDAFNRPITTKTNTTVHNVLVAPVGESGEEILTELSMDGKKNTYIVKCAVKAYAKVLEANAIVVVKLDDYMMRRKCQIQARKKLKAMLGLIEIAYTTLSLEDDRLEYWTGYVKNCLELLSKWRAADRKRYAKQLNGEITRKGEKPGNPL